MKVLSLDIGGTHVKALCSDIDPREERMLPTKNVMTPQLMVKAVQNLTSDWQYDAVSVGFPSVVRHGQIVVNPAHLGEGWVGFDFGEAFGKPTHIINDAAMQAIGSFQKGRMLFLGLGTGLGSAMVLEGLVQPMELAHLPYKDGRSYEDFTGQIALDTFGVDVWREHVYETVRLFQFALQPDEVVLGGGNIAHLNLTPDGVRLGNNQLAFSGGFRLWQDPIFRSVL